MIMCHDSKSAQTSYPILDRSIGLRNTTINKGMSNYTLISSKYVNSICDFKSILKYNCNCDGEQ